MLFLMIFQYITQNTVLYTVVYATQIDTDYVQMLSSEPSHLQGLTNIFNQIKGPIRMASDLILKYVM